MHKPIGCTSSVGEFCIIYNQLSTESKLPSIVSIQVFDTISVYQVSTLYSEFPDHSDNIQLTEWQASYCGTRCPRSLNVTNKTRVVKGSYGC